MFSYRHAFHAGNHADVLKHTVLVSIVQYLIQKETSLTVVDTHAGAGVYRLDGDYAHTSAESLDGVLRMETHVRALPDEAALAPVLARYRALVRSFNQGAAIKVYPGSPFILHELLREHDKLKLFELHPTDTRALSGHVAQLNAGRKIAVLREDGFEGYKKFFPPPSRRGLLLCDPSYEIKTDYERVQEMVKEGLKRFATGCYMIWYPIIPRTQAHDLPKRLKTITQQAGRTGLNITLTVRSGGHQQAGLPGSGVFVINPPHVLKAEMQQALPQLVDWLGQDGGANYTLA